jgi:hypothetical protein
MPRLHRRSRVVSIRLSDEEYGQLRSLCAIKGADSISELARAALKLLVMEHQSRGPAMEARVNEIDVRIDLLNREVARLSSKIGLAQEKTQ